MMYIAIAMHVNDYPMELSTVQPPLNLPLQCCFDLNVVALIYQTPNCVTFLKGFTGHYQTKSGVQILYVTVQAKTSLATYFIVIYITKNLLSQNLHISRSDITSSLVSFA